MLTRQQFDQEVSGLEPQLKAMGLTVDDARRQFFRNTIGPTLKGKPKDEKAKALEDWGIVPATARQANTPIEKVNEVGHFFTQGLKAGAGTGLTGTAVNAISRHMGKGDLIADKEVAAPDSTGLGPMAQATGAVVGSFLDPFGRAIDIVTGGVGGKVTAKAVGKLTTQAPKVAKVVEKVSPAIYGGVSGGIQGGATSVLGGNPQDALKNTALGFGLASLLGLRQAHAIQDNHPGPKTSDAPSSPVVAPTAPLPKASKTGPFGPVFEQFRGKPQEAIQHLLQVKDGEAVGALHHPDVGEIDLVWGKPGTGKSDGYGLSKLAEHHPEVLDNLQGIISSMQVESRSANRIRLKSDTHRASVRLDWNGKEKRWLVTAFKIDDRPVPGGPPVPGNNADAPSPASRGGLNETIPQPGSDLNTLDLNQRKGELGMAMPVDNSPILKVLEGGAQKLGGSQTQPVAPAPVKVAPETTAALGADAANLKGEAAKVVNQAAGELPRKVASPEAVAKVDPTEFLNLDKMNMSESGKQTLGRLVQESVAETGGNPKQRVTFDQIRKEAADLDPALVSTLKPLKAGETLHPAVRLAAKQHLNELASQVDALTKEIAQGQSTLTAKELEAKQGLLNNLERDAKGLVDVLYPARSQDGRNLAFHRIMAEQSFDADYWLSRARRSSGGALPEDTHSKLLGIIGRGSEAMKTGDQAAVRQAKMDLSKELMKLDRTKPIETLTALRKAGLLTGIKTHLKNVAGNAGFQVMEEASRIPASIADIGMKLFTGQRTVAGANPASFGRSSIEAATKGLSEANQVLQHGATEDQLARLDIGRQVNSGSKLLDGYINGTFRLLGAEDRIFKSFAFRRSLEEQARVMALNAKNQGLSKQLVVKPTEAMIAQAIADAEFATFNNDNLMASAIERGKSVHPAVRTAADLVVPFVKTPTNVIARVLEYSGAHAVAKAPKAIVKLVNNTLTPEEQRSFAQSLGRGVVGLPGIILLGYKLAQAGAMTGTYQSDPKDKGLNEAANRPAGAIKLDGKWHQVGGLSPWGNLLVLGATMYRDAKDAPDALSAAGTVASLGVKTALDQPFLQGVEGVTDLAKDPGKGFPKFAGDLAGSFVPTILSDIGTATDTKQRDAEGIAQGVQKRIPGLRNQLPAKVDALGQEVANDQTNAINPLMSRPAKEETDPVVGELVRLGVGLTKPDDNAKIKGERVKLSGDQQRELTMLAGERIKAKLDKLVNSPRYQSFDDEKRRDLIEKVIQNERHRARAAFTRTLIK